MTESPAKPCPFCDCKPIVYTRESGETAVECATRHGCPMSAGWTLLEDWNRRPIEDALRAEIQQLKSDLQGEHNVNAYLNRQNIDVAKEIGQLREQVNHNAALAREEQIKRQAAEERAKILNDRLAKIHQHLKDNLILKPSDNWQWGYRAAILAVADLLLFEQTEPKGGEK